MGLINLEKRNKVKWRRKNFETNVGRHEGDEMGT